MARAHLEVEEISPLTGPSSSMPAGALTALLELCGEIALTSNVERQNPVAHEAARPGLQILDMLLRPDHVLRATDHIEIASTRLAHRRMELELHPNALGEVRLAHARRLSMLLAAGMDAPSQPAAASLFLPLIALPRPVPSPIEVRGSDGRILARPPQRLIRASIQAALWHVFWESLRDRGTNSAVPDALTGNNLTRPLLRQAIHAVVADGAGHPRSSMRRREVLGDPPRPGTRVATKETLDEGIEALKKRLKWRGVAAVDQLNAVTLLTDESLDLAPFLFLLDVVRTSYAVVAGVDPARIDGEVLSLELPDLAADRDQGIGPLVRRVGRAFDPREHNFSAQALIAVPPRLRQYRMNVTAVDPSAAGSQHIDVAVMGTVVDSPDPTPYYSRTLGVSVSQLRKAYETADATAARLAIQILRPVLTSLGSLVEAQRTGAENLRHRWRGIGSGVISLGAQRFERERELLGAVIDDAVAELRSAEALEGATVVGRMTVIADGVGRVLMKLGDVLDLNTQLVSEELPGGDAGQLRVNRRGTPARVRSEGKKLVAWVVMRDESMQRGMATIVPAVGSAFLVWTLGWFMFGRSSWPFTYQRGVIGDAEHWPVEPAVAVLLLVPGFVLTIVRFAPAESIVARLRRSIFTETYVLCFGYLVSAVALAGPARPGSRSPYPNGSGMWFYRSMQVTFWVSVLLACLAIVAYTVRTHYMWRPKGFDRSLGSPYSERTRAARSAQRRWCGRLRARIREPSEYNHKRPDARFSVYPTRAGQRDSWTFEADETMA